MPKKLRELIASLKRAGFSERQGKGSHRIFQHETGVYVVLSGKPGNDAKKYQERQVAQAIQQTTK